VKLCAVTQSYAPTGGGVRTMLHAQRDWCRDHDMPHVLIVPGAEDTVVRDGPLVTYTVARRSCPARPCTGCCYAREGAAHPARRDAGRDRDALRVQPAVDRAAASTPARRDRERGLHDGPAGRLRRDAAAAGLARRGRAAGFVARRARGLAERYLRALYGRCDVVVAISPVMRDRLLELRRPRPQLVPLGVDLDTFSPDRRDPALRRVFDVGEHDLLLVYSGRLDGEKRPDVVLEAFARLRAERMPRATLVLAGDGPLREQLEARAVRSGGRMCCRSSSRATSWRRCSRPPTSTCRRWRTRRSACPSSRHRRAGCRSSGCARAR
jgi:alpha-1,6-mannosyltransferase